MKFEVQSSVSLVFLSIVNMCLCVQDFAEKTLNTLSTELSHAKRHHQQSMNHHHHNHQHVPHRFLDNAEDFLLIDYLADGEMERRISFNGVTAKETTIGNSSKSLSLWQLSNGIAFIQMIYSKDDELIDCEYVRKKHFVRDFLSKFYGEVDSARARNFTTPSALSMVSSPPPHRTTIESSDEIDTDLQYSYPDRRHDASDAFGMRTLEYRQLRDAADMPDDMRPLMNYNGLKMQCDNRHRQMKRIVHEMNGEHPESRKNATEHLERKKRSLSEWLIAPNTKWCGRGQAADEYNQLGGASKADKCCRRHDHCRFNIHALTSRWNMFNYRPFTISHCSCDTRQRRDISNLFRVPGTKWCGKGYTATKYTDMGGLSRADRCCRQHDKACPFWIMGFETKYGFFNLRVNTLMHCKCDERFRTCLKMADSSDATLVGKLFFNIVQTKCFVLKPEKVCKKWSWWRKCEKKVIRKKAHLRDNRKF